MIMYNQTWNRVFKDFREAKMIVLEWEKDRRGKYESEETWDEIIQEMYNIEMTKNPYTQTDKDKIKQLMSIVGQKILHDSSTYPKKWMIKHVKITRNKINYYKNNPEEE